MHVFHHPSRDWLGTLVNMVWLCLENLVLPKSRGQNHDFSIFPSVNWHLGIFLGAYRIVRDTASSYEYQVDDIVL